jgi:hypothetical protein
LFIAKRQDALLYAWAGSGIKRLACSSKRIALLMDKLLNAQRKFHFATTIESLPRTALIGFEAGKLRLPETEDIGFNAADAGYVSNAEIKPIGDFSRWRQVLPGGLCGHPLLRNYL